MAPGEHGGQSGWPLGVSAIIDWKQKLTSRKFWMAVVSALLMVAKDGLGLELPSETIIALAAVAISYILGESYVDAHRRPTAAAEQAQQAKGVYPC